MNKELYVSSTPHETRLAMSEDEEIAEVYYEREKEYSLAGSIYKGRVTRVLPGMQSAFVDIGLERDAFLYVSDFFEDSEEYDRVVSEAETAVARLDQPAGDARPPAAVEGDLAAAPPRDEHREDRRGGRRGRHRGRRGRTGIPAEKFARPDGSEEPSLPASDLASAADEPEPEPDLAAPSAPVAAFVLPGESLAKYRHAASESPAAPVPSAPAQHRDAGPEPSASLPQAARSAQPSGVPRQSMPQPERGGRAARTAGDIGAENRGADRGDPPPANDAARTRPDRGSGAPGLAERQAGGVAQPRQAPRQSIVPAAVPVTVAAATFVLPGESLAKYRHAAPAPLAMPGRQALTPLEPEVESEAESDSPAHSDVPPVLAQWEADGGEADEDEAQLSAAADRATEEDQLQPDAPFSYGAEAAEDADGSDDEAHDFEALPPAGEEDASASVRAPEAQARLQAPASADERRNERRGGRRHRRRRRPDLASSEPAAASADTPAPEAAPAPREPREGKNESPRLISDLLHEGQEILVQIAKEPLGKKGARITSHLALPGRYLVYMPTVHHIGVSRRIASDEERARLKRLILEHSQDLPGGFIVRTAGGGASEDELVADIRLLANQWNDMRQQFEQVRSPALLHHDLDLVERTLRDQLSGDFTHIWVDTDEQFQRVSKFVNFFMPQLVDRVRLYTREEPMFEHFGVQEEINKALHSKVWLKSGGYIVLNQTEALVAIDVNTGKYVGRSNRLEDTIVKTNVEAIKEIVRQIRLRDLGGIVVIDFIDMDERKNRQKVMQTLEDAMRADRAPSKILSFNDFGLVVLTRKRVKQSLERTLGTPCPYCEGVGLVKSSITVANEIYSEVKRVAPSIERDDLVLRVNPEIAKMLKAQNAQRLREMEDQVRKSISVRPDPQVHQERFEIY